MWVCLAIGHSISLYYRFNGMVDDLGNVLREHRQLSGLTQAELARLAGVGKTAIFDLEHGKETVQLDTLKKVMATLNIDIVLHSPVMARSQAGVVKNRTT